MTIIYDVIGKRFSGDYRPNITLFYDPERKAALKFMNKYSKQNGFTFKEKGKEFAIADLMLREREADGTVISETPYCELFDEFGSRKEGQAL